MEYITFSLHAMKEFIRLAPAGTPVFYLNGFLCHSRLVGRNEIHLLVYEPLHVFCFIYSPYIDFQSEIMSFFDPFGDVS